MQEYVDIGKTSHLLHHLDVTKRAAQSDTTELDDRPDKKVSDEDSKIEKEKIDLNAAEIRNIYVRLIILLRHQFIHALSLSTTI